MSMTERPKGWKFDADRDTGIDCSKDKPLVKQEFKDDADMNVIFERCTRAGVWPDSVNVSETFADVSRIPDFQGAMDAVGRAREAFMELPAATRAFFDHDPAKCVAFAADPKNFDMAVKFGLLENKKEVKVEEPPEAPKAKAPDASAQGGDAPKA